MSDAKAVEARLRAIMQSWLLPIEPGCEQHLTELIRQGAQRFEADGFGSDPVKLWEAETNFRNFLSQMTWEAGALGYHELHEDTFFRAKSRLCPIWPFC